MISTCACLALPRLAGWQYLKSSHADGSARCLSSEVQQLTQGVQMNTVCCLRVCSHMLVMMRRGSHWAGVQVRVDRSHSPQSSQAEHSSENGLVPALKLRCGLAPSVNGRGRSVMDQGHAFLSQHHSTTSLARTPAAVLTLFPISELCVQQTAAMRIPARRLHRNLSSLLTSQGFSHAIRVLSSSRTSCTGPHLPVPVPPDHFVGPWGISGSACAVIPTQQGRLLIAILPNAALGTLLPF